MKKFTLLSLLFFTVYSWGQRPRWYEFNQTTQAITGPNDFPTNAIADDFGPRDHGNDDFHAGIDYNSSQGAGNAQKWYLNVSPIDGLILDANKLLLSNIAYKYGLVNSLSNDYTLLFGHVFEDNQLTYDEFSHSIILNWCEPPYDDKWGMVLDFSNQPSEFVYGQVEGATITTSTASYVTTNMVNSGNPFIPLGDSGGNFVPHLHLATLPYGTDISSDAINGDPCQFLDYDVPTYDVNVWSQLNNSAINIKYPGTSSTKIAARVRMSGEPLGANRYNHLMDVNH